MCNLVAQVLTKPIWTRVAVISLDKAIKEGDPLPLLRTNAQTKGKAIPTSE
jgi:hypothetical protein